MHLAGANPATEALIEANNLTAEAGLGACSPEQEAKALVEAVAKIRRDMAPWGIKIPVFQHDVLGTV